jgi:endonuclease/exonuclease/phosphatase (EEP) superfamily protein YafD
MKHLRFELPSVLLFICLFSSFASAGAHEDMVAKYIALSGIGDTLRSIPGDIDSLASQKNLTSKHPDVDQRVYLLMKESFDVEQAEKTLSAYLVENTDEQFLGEVLRWLESPLARKITNEEVN